MCSGLEDCVEYMACVNDWLADVRTDSPPPVVIDIGAGTFGHFICNGGESVTPSSSEITLRGAGRPVTRIQNNATGGHGLSFNSCAGIEVQHLTVDAKEAGIAWGGPGDSTYTDIDVRGGSYAWWEAGVANPSVSCLHPVSEHWSWSSIWRDKTLGQSDYVWAASCSRSFFFDSEVQGLTNAFSLSHDAEVELYGSVVRVVVPGGTSGGGQVSAVLNPQTGLTDPGLHPGGEFHMHGGLIAVDAHEATGNVDAVAILAANGAVTRIQETAFLLKPAGTGAAIRIWDAGGESFPSVFEAPLLLASGQSTPTTGSGGGPYWSLGGQDMYVETDCLPDGNCDSVPAGTETHLMVYSDYCDTSGPWFDTVTGRCRGVLP
jgi:hypothetical protein